MSWQRANVQAAAKYLRERMATGTADARTRAIYEGLLEVLDPVRRATRLQRELAEAAKAAVSVRPERDRRSGERRKGDRRRLNLGSPSGFERRKGERRRGRDRRSGR